MERRIVVVVDHGEGVSSDQALAKGTSYNVPEEITSYRELKAHLEERLQLPTNCTLACLSKRNTVLGSESFVWDDLRLDDHLKSPATVDVMRIHVPVPAVTGEAGPAGVSDNLAREVRDLLTSIPPFPLDDDRVPTVDELSAYLMDFSCLESNVPMAHQPLLGFTELSSSKKPFIFSTSELGVVAADLAREPLRGEGEMVANFRLIKYVDLLFLLKDYAPHRHQLEASLGMDKAVPENSTQSARCRKRKRPDTYIKSLRSLLLFGEGKENVSAFEVAVKELSDKMNTVPHWVFGKLQFTLGTAVGGSAVQLLLKRPSSQAESVTKRFSLDVKADRVMLILVFIKMYSVMLSMARIGDAGDEARILPLFFKHQRANSCVELDGEGCVKTIRKWNEFRNEFDVDLESVRAAYTAAASVDQLVKAEVFPQVTKDKYMVRTRPLGYSAEYKLKKEAAKEQECKKLMRDMLHALAGLHKAGLVHRDVRLANIIWWPDKQCYVLIDLETVARSGVEMPDLWTDYTLKTLKSSRYEETSDLHQLGVLLHKLSPTGAKGFVCRLKGHRSSAQTLLQDAWLK